MENKTVSLEELQRKFLGDPFLIKCRESIADVLAASALHWYLENGEVRAFLTPAAQKLVNEIEKQRNNYIEKNYSDVWDLIKD